MKFRATMQDLQCMREFQHLITTLTKLSKECVLRIAANTLTFIVNEESSAFAPMVWTHIDVSAFFTTYAMEGVQQNNPNILLALSTANLGRAFMRCNLQQLKMKLTNVQFPCLTIETASVIPNAVGSRVVVHDVPVNVIPQCDWPAYTIPQIPKCTLGVRNMPLNRMVRGLIDKLKNLSPTIIFYASTRGELNLVAETESATITTRYKNLIVRTCDAIDSNDMNTSVSARNNDNNEDTAASCSVDCKKSAMFFSALQVPASELYCGIKDDQCIHLEVNVRAGVVIHSILPATCT